jgi:hypothetical protein
MIEAEEDAMRCAACLGPEVQVYLEYTENKFGSLNGPMWALLWGFARLLSEMNGDISMRKQTLLLYTEMSLDDRAAAREGKHRIDEILLAMRQKGFSTTALAWAFIGILTNIMSQSSHRLIPDDYLRAERETRQFTEDLITSLNKARRTLLN